MALRRFVQKTFYNIRRKISISISVGRFLVALTAVTALCTVLFVCKNQHESGHIRWNFSILSLSNQQLKKPFFIKRNHLDCARVMAADLDYISTIDRESIAGDEQFLDYRVDCDRIKRRYYFAREHRSESERRFPIAFAILVYRDYHYVELTLSAIYASQNIYCYHIDSKSSPEFRQKMQILSQCLPNVHLTRPGYAVSSSGSNMSNAFMSCFQSLKHLKQKWKYVLSLQANDFPLKTNAELVEILTILNGSNDVELLFGNRYPKNYNSWMYKDLRLFRQENNSVLLNQSLQFYKGSIATVLSREFIDFLVDELNVTELLKRLDLVPYSDEMFISTLNHDLNIRAPGGYPGACLLGNSNKMKPWISRFAVWRQYKQVKCHSGHWRHSVCIFGLEDLAQLGQRPELFANKFLPEFDMSAVQCLHEALFNRTVMNSVPINGRRYPTLNYDYYKTLASVQYQNWRNYHANMQLKGDFKCVYCEDCQH